MCSNVSAIFFTILFSSISLTYDFFYYRDSYCKKKCNLKMSTLFSYEIIKIWLKMRKGRLPSVHATTKISELAPPACLLEGNQCISINFMSKIFLYRNYTLKLEEKQHQLNCDDLENKRQHTCYISIYRTQLCHWFSGFVPFPDFLCKLVFRE